MSYRLLSCDEIPIPAHKFPVDICIKSPTKFDITAVLTVLRWVRPSYMMYLLKRKQFYYILLEKWWTDGL